MSIRPEERALFLECFPETEKEADIILDFAKNNGEFHSVYENGVLINMICTTPISDNGFNADYAFACGTKKTHRGQGLFRRHLNEVVGENRSLLIPENEELYRMYEHLGYEPIFCLEAEFNGSGDAIASEADIDELFDIYKRSYLFPKKSFELFKATLNAFVSYGGKAVKNGLSVLLVYGDTATETFAPDPETAVNAARICKKALFPMTDKPILDRLNIKYEKKRIAMAKNIPAEVMHKIFINNLFN